LSKLHRRALFGVSRWGRLTSVPESHNQVPGEGERAGWYAPDAIHLLSMLVYKCGNGVWGAIIFVYFDEAVIAFLEFMCSRAT
jgi:hypothetical protein